MTTKLFLFFEYNLGLWTKSIFLLMWFIKISYHVKGMLIKIWIAILIYLSHIAMKEKRIPDIYLPVTTNPLAKMGMKKNTDTFHYLGTSPILPNWIEEDIWMAWNMCAELSDTGSLLLWNKWIKVWKSSRKYFHKFLNSF